MRFAYMQQILLILEFRFPTRFFGKKNFPPRYAKNARSDACNEPRRVTTDDWYDNSVRKLYLG
jgi:hypothetical protein